jgi:hypothetical protein
MWRFPNLAAGSTMRRYLEDKRGEVIGREEVKGKP